MESPHQDALWHSEWQDCVRDIARLFGKGGDAKLAGRLWPSKPPAQATAWLRDCLNPDRAAKLDTDELLHLLRIGRQMGYHGLMFHLCDEAAYSRPAPITPEDQADEARRQIVETSRILKRALDVLERLEA